MTTQNNLLELATNMTRNLDQLVTFEFTKDPGDPTVALDDTHIQVYIDGEPESGWTTPERMEAWLLGANWYAQHTGMVTP